MPSRVSRSTIRRRRATLGLALIAVAALLGISASNGSDVTPGADGREGTEHVPAQVRAGAAMTQLAERIAAPWVKRRAESGLFTDPVTGGSGHGYGPAMIAEVLIRTGVRRDDRGMLHAGLRALSVDATAAAGDGDPGNPLELLAIASAYTWGERNLAGTRAWKRWSRGPREYLRRWESAGVGLAAQRCFASPMCWNNYKIVDAAAELMLLETGLRPTSPAARLAQPEAARTAAMGILRHDVQRAIGHAATTQGPDGTLTGLGVLSDQPGYPLAYHAMSVAGLAKALAVLGDRAPAAARESFRRAMLAQASFMAPDGDVSFLGRAQGESWALAATAYAGESCAGMFWASHPRTAGSCATLAIRAVARLQRLHRFHGGLMAIVPRLSTMPLSGDGFEHYVRVMTFNGLTAMFLAWAGDAARTETARRVAPRSLPLDRGGTFADPDRARFAVVHRGRLWYAVHSIGPPISNDLRYDFGLLAVKLRRGQRWVDLLPPRPFDQSAGPLDGLAPALATPSGLAFARGTRFRVDRRSGEVIVHGGYRTPAGVWALRGLDFRFKPSRRGVTLVAPAPPGSVLRFEDYLPAPWTEIADGASVLRIPTAAARLSPAPATLEYGRALTSANSVDLQGYRRSVTVPADGRVSWTLTARTLPR